MNSPVLNSGQQLAADGFFAFLMGSDKELNISGPGGVGKTFLMGYLIDSIIPKYHKTCQLLGIAPIYKEVVMTATTNRAAEVLSEATGKEAITIHSFLGLRVADNYQTGETTLHKTNAWTIKTNLIIFIDEGSCIGWKLLEIIRGSTLNCKIVYVGDHCQLAPVKETISPIYTQKLPLYELTEPMRNSGQPQLMALCDQLRETVKTGIFKPIKIIPGVVDLFTNPQMQAAIDASFIDPDTDSRILAYSNPRVNAYNEYIRELRMHVNQYTVGEHLISNTSVKLAKDVMLSVEEPITIHWLADSAHEVTIEEDNTLMVREATLQLRHGQKLEVLLPEDKSHFTALIKYYQRMKQWQHYFHLKNTYPDLRPRDASTVHKAQGSTFDKVFIDIGNIGECRNPQEAARMLYVAVTRAKNGIHLFGDLPTKYGSFY